MKTVASGAAFVWMILMQFMRWQFVQVRQVATGTLANWLEQEQPLCLLDTRTIAEFSVSHLPQAQWFDSESQQFSAPLDSLIVVYCSVGYRSSVVATCLQRLGYQNVFNLEGGIFQWANEGRQVIRDDRPVQQVHSFNAHWGMLLRSDWRVG